MKYLISGSTSLFFKNGMFFDFFKKNGAKNVIVICEHHTSGGDSSYNRVIDNAKDIKDLNINFYRGTEEFFKGIKGDLSKFDGVYVTGGMTQDYLDFLDKNNIRDLIKSFVINQKNVYVGASAGTLALFEKFNTESEPEYVHLSQFITNGLGVVKELLIEVHFKEFDNDQYMIDRAMATLKANPDLKYAIFMDYDSCIQVDNFDDFSYDNVNVVCGKIHKFNI
jgi:peptidase E